MLPDVQKRDTYLGNFESGLDKAGYLLGPFIGPPRMTMGKVMMLASFILAMSYLMAYAFDVNQNEEHLKQAKDYAGYFIHGTLNVIKGIFQTFAFSGGIVLLLAYDLSGYRFHYSREEVSGGGVTLNPSHPDFPKHSKLLFVNKR